MNIVDQSSLISDYQRNGYVSPVSLITPDEASIHRQALEDAEAKFGDLHYKTKVHTILRSPFQLSKHSKPV